MDFDLWFFDGLLCVPNLVQYTVQYIILKVIMVTQKSNWNKNKE